MTSAIMIGNCSGIRNSAFPESVYITSFRCSSAALVIIRTKTLRSKVQKLGAKFIVVLIALSEQNLRLLQLFDAYIALNFSK